MTQKNQYKTLYKRLKDIGINMEPFSVRLGYTRTGIRNWFDLDRLDERRALELVCALEQLQSELQVVTKMLRRYR